MTRPRWMALFFALGSTCFLIGPLPGYVQLVGESADVITFFGSILFTAGGGLQSWLAWSERHSPGGGGAAWWAAIIQSVGTLFFNLTTYQAMHTALTSPEYNKLVWRPDWRGSICFLISGAIASRASSRHGWLPVRGGARWWLACALDTLHTDRVSKVQPRFGGLREPLRSARRSGDRSARLGSSTSAPVSSDGSELRQTFVCPGGEASNESNPEQPPGA